MPFDTFALNLRQVFDLLARNSEPVLIEREGQVFRLEKEGATEDIWSTYDPDHVRQALRLSVGALRGIDREQLKRELQQQREQNSPGRPG